MKLVTLDEYLSVNTVYYNTDTYNIYRMPIVQLLIYWKTLLEKCF